jgi:hypothetical protein
MFDKLYNKTYNLYEYLHVKKLFCMVKHDNNMEHINITNGIPKAPMKAHETTEQVIAPSTEIFAVQKETQEEITDQIKIEIGKLCADTLKKIKDLQKSDDPNKHEQIVELRAHLHEHLTPEVIDEMLDKGIPILGKATDSEASHKMAQRGIEYKVLEGMYDIDTGKIKIGTLNIIDGLKEDTHEKTIFLLEAIKIRDFEKQVHGLNANEINVGTSIGTLHAIMRYAIKNEWIFEKDGKLQSTITLLYEDKEHAPSFIQSENEITAHMFKKSFKHAVRALIASIESKEKQLNELDSEQLEEKRKTSLTNHIIQKISAMKAKM